MTAKEQVRVQVLAGREGEDWPERTREKYADMRVGAAVEGTRSSAYRSGRAFGVAAADRRTGARPERMESLVDSQRSDKRIGALPQFPARLSDSLRYAKYYNNQADDAWHVAENVKSALKKLAYRLR